jgi:hypothetical protein
LNTAKISEILEDLREPFFDFCDLKLSEKPNYFSGTNFSDILYQRLEQAETKHLWVLDRAYLLEPGTLDELLVVKDHVNLSTLNPTLGPLKSGPRFYAVNELYYKPTELADLPEVVVAGFNPGAVPRKAEAQILLESKIKTYSYNLVLAALMAAQKGLKVVGLLYR